ncbi:hypothetical protein BD779DRAFT_1474970 [Infundibulicybe gibba]|nr:hypothetical protein BD779DRAFT_1474970 [Infundibulicybe gibba]
MGVTIGEALGCGMAGTICVKLSLEVMRMYDGGEGGGRLMEIQRGGVSDMNNCMDKFPQPSFSDTHGTKKKTLQTLQTTPLSPMPWPSVGQRDGHSPMRTAAVDGLNEEPPSSPYYPLPTHRSNELPESSIDPCLLGLTADGRGPGHVSPEMPTQVSSEMSTQPTTEDAQPTAEGTAGANGNGHGSGAKKHQRGTRVRITKTNDVHGYVSNAMRGGDNFEILRTGQLKDPIDNSLQASKQFVRGMGEIIIRMFAKLLASRRHDAQEMHGKLLESQRKEIETRKQLEASAAEAESSKQTIERQQRMLDEQTMLLEQLWQHLATQ